MAGRVSQERADRARRLLSIHTARTVSALTGIPPATLYRLKKRNWKAAETTRPFRPRPTDFAVQSRHMTGDEMCAHYRASTRTVTRWLRELRG